MLGPVARRDRALLRLFVALFIALALVLSLAIVKNTAVLLPAPPVVAADALYEADPLSLIAGYNLTTYYTLDEDLWDVWICEVDEGNLDLSPERAVNLLESEIVPLLRLAFGGPLPTSFRAAGQ